jgi:hypothetical protein
VEELSSYAEDIVERFRPKGLLVDTNLLLVYAIGKYDASILERQSFNRVASYTKEDYDLLTRLMSIFTRMVTTPHVLTEVSNWIGHLPQQQKQECLKSFPVTFASFIELQFDSFELSKENHFTYLGLTDTALARVANEYLVLTDDARFIGHMTNLGLDALNINHIREQVWFPESII